MHSFVFNVEKLQNSQLQHAHSHNVRARPTASQLPRSAWFTEEGRHEAVAWNADRLAIAHQLARRKDAVEALSFVIQFGDQTDWRGAPTRDDKHGQPLDWPVNLKQAGEAIERWAALEFGRENVVSLELHTDESTPHFHLICTPIHDGKLQAKHWLNGAASVAALRKRAHAEISKTVSCTYQPGRPGGEPHDASKAAGAANARQPAPEVGLLGKLRGDDVRQENERLRAENTQLHTELKAARQAARLADKARLRREEERELRERATNAEARASKAEESEKTLRHENSSLRERLRGEQLLTEQLRPEERQALAQRARQGIEIQRQIERLEAQRGEGEITDQQAAEWLQQHGESHQRAYSNYVGQYGNEVTELLTAQKRALSVPNDAGQAKTRPEPQNASKRDSEAPSMDF
jgi:hypothetical protein